MLINLQDVIKTALYYAGDDKTVDTDYSIYTMSTTYYDRNYEQTHKYVKTKVICNLDVLIETLMKIQNGFEKEDNIINYNDIIDYINECMFTDIINNIDCFEYFPYIKITEITENDKTVKKVYMHFNNKTGEINPDNTEIEMNDFYIDILIDNLLVY